jgi:hypothetical protein
VPVVSSWFDPLMDGKEFSREIKIFLQLALTRCRDNCFNARSVSGRMVSDKAKLKYNDDETTNRPPPRQ